MHEYVFKMKKGDIEIELQTDNISFFEQQVNNWNEKLLNIKYEEPTQIVSNEKVENCETPEHVEPAEEKTEDFSMAENVTDNQTEQENQQVDFEQEDIEKESQRILNEYKAELEQDEQQKENFNQEIKNLIEETKDNEEQEEPQQNQEIESSSEEDLSNQTNFDVLLQESMSQCISNMQENRDENFINHVKEKNITEKIDFLITTAYYLENHENYTTFTLTQINKKLTENSFESIDYSVMQDAVENGFAEIVPKDMAMETEYKLTEVYKNFVAERAQNV